MIRYLVYLLLWYPSISLGSTVELTGLKCLTDNIYFEARGESILGQVLVAKTVINRMHDPRWPSTVCDVVYQKHQYSWTSQATSNIDDYQSYALAQSIAYLILENQDMPETYLGDHYLRCDYKQKVKWWHDMLFLGQVGDHCFYASGASGLLRETE